MINFDANMYLAVDSLIKINSLITVSNNITLWKDDVKPYRFDKMYMGKDLVEDKLYQAIDQFNQKKITNAKIYLIILNEQHPLYDANGRTCKILFSNDNKINLLMRQKNRKS